MSQGAEMIAKERARQVEQEGWSAAHDAEHTDGGLLSAAVTYAWHVKASHRSDAEPLSIWPWHADWWKPSVDPVRNLVKAGALIAAEIDRLAAGRATEGQP
jgi:hypothetical protein